MRCSGRRETARCGRFNETRHAVEHRLAGIFAGEREHHAVLFARFLAVNARAVDFMPAQRGQDRLLNIGRLTLLDHQHRGFAGAELHHLLGN